jgi:hypothetical protein
MAHDAFDFALVRTQSGSRRSTSLEGSASHTQPTPQAAPRGPSEHSRAFDFCMERQPPQLLLGWKEGRRAACTPTPHTAPRGHLRAAT